MPSSLELEAFENAVSEYRLSGGGSWRGCETGSVVGTGKLFNSETFSDITFRCGERTWPAHRNIICLQSKVFLAALQGPWEESRTREFNFDDEDPDTAHLFLQALYYSEVHNHESFSMPELAGVYAMAVKYDAPCIADSAFDVLTGQLMCSGVPLKSMCNAARILWTKTPSMSDRLRIAFLYYFRTRNLLRHDAVLGLVQEVPEFALDMHLAMVKLAQDTAERDERLGNENLQLGHLFCPRCDQRMVNHRCRRGKHDWS